MYTVDVSCILRNHSDSSETVYEDAETVGANHARTKSQTNVSFPSSLKTLPRLINSPIQNSTPLYCT